MRARFISGSEQQRRRSSPRRANSASSGWAPAHSHPSLGTNRRAARCRAPGNPKGPPRVPVQDRSPPIGEVVADQPIPLLHEACLRRSGRAHRDAAGPDPRGAQGSRTGLSRRCPDRGDLSGLGLAGHGHAGGQRRPGVGTPAPVLDEQAPRGRLLGVAGSLTLDADGVEVRRTGRRGGLPLGDSRTGRTVEKRLGFERAAGQGYISSFPAVMFQCRNPKSRDVTPLIILPHYNDGALSRPDQIADKHSGGGVSQIAAPL